MTRANIFPFIPDHVASTFAALSAASMTYGPIVMEGCTWWPWRPLSLSE